MTARRNPDPFVFGSLFASHPWVMLAIAGGILWWARNPAQARQLAAGAGIKNLPSAPSWAGGGPAPVTPAAAPGVYKATGT